MTYSELWAMQDAKSAEVDSLMENYKKTLAKEKNAENKEWAEVETARAKLIYLTAHAAYIDFLNKVNFEEISA